MKYFHSHLQILLLTFLVYQQTWAIEEMRLLDRPNPFFVLKSEIKELQNRDEFYITLTVQQLDLSQWNLTGDNYYFAFNLVLGELPDNSLDLVRCEYHLNEPDKGFFCLDQSINNQGVLSNDLQQDVTGVYTWNAEVLRGSAMKAGYFEMTFTRPLITDDSRDIQFTQKNKPVYIQCGFEIGELSQFDDTQRMQSYRLKATNLLLITQGTSLVKYALSLLSLIMISVSLNF
ncbi:UNKNOWN [Stylonychia lemnae]|uniref:Uncharacterized protein n=1 Tax=Stylonychia lemnae TaxID=5949 RepID=A0A077ZVS8_STYLE|nr:UNKNOWN [Stylonychia lemnae]|eukprot:CDW73350.1 UNKNOWN [Stylonychia lemnae]